MATLDQLSADRRAILELVLKRGQSYEDIADSLGMPAARVREHAREALVSLAPRTADRVDSEWRDQLADYVLGQQSGPESKATRGHLKRSEPARAWALSMLDSLGDLYQDGAEPEVPEPDKAGERPRRRRRDTDGAGADADAAAAKATTAGKRKTAPPKERDRAKESERPPAEPRATDRPLSPEARAAVRRRRIAGALAAVALLAFIIFVFPVPQITGDDDESQTDVAGTPAAQEQAQILSQLELAPVGNADGGGVALVTEQAGQRQLIVQARLEPTQRNEAYEVWLYNSQDDAVSLGAQVTDDQGNYQGAGPLPENFEEYEFIDISRETTDDNSDHSGESVLRGQLAGGQPVPGAGGAAPPGTEVPQPGGTPTLPEGGAPLPGEPPAGGGGGGNGGGGSGGGGNP